MGRMCKDWELEANLVYCPRLFVVLIFERTGSGRTAHHQTHTYEFDFGIAFRKDILMDNDREVANLFKQRAKSKEQRATTFL